MRAQAADEVRPEIVNAYLDDDERTIIVRERSGEVVAERRVRAEYTTWHRASEVNAARMRQLKRLPIVRSVRVVGDFVRVGWVDEIGRRMGMRGMRENDVATFEGDVDPVTTWLVDAKAKIAKPRRCYLDLEADSDVPLSRKEDMRILSWAVVGHDDEHDEHTGVLEEDTDASERKLLVKLAHVLDNYDQIVVWEGDWKGGEFDSVVLPARWNKRRAPVDERRWLWLNQLAVWKRMNQHSAESGAEKESFKLGDIAHEQIGEGKEEVPDWVVERFGAEKCKRGLGAMTRELWDAGGKFRKLLEVYNLRDSRILRKLEMRKGYITLFDALCDVCGILPVTKSLEPTRQMDGFMFRLGREKGVRFATKRFREGGEEEEKERKKFKGAVVFHPKSVEKKPKKDDPAPPWTAEDARKWRTDNGFVNGILRNVHVCDFSGMYPSIMLTWNLGAEVIAGWGKDPAKVKPGTCLSPGTGLVTRTDEIGMVTYALRELIRLRKVWADRAASLPPGTPEWQDAFARSTAYKVAANSFYGAGGSPFSRFYNRDVSESTTQNGVHLLKLAAAEAEKRCMVLVYGDTDSNMVIRPSLVAFGKYVDWLNAKRFPAEVEKYGCKENHIKIAFEKSYERIVFVSAKRYVARYLHYKWKTTCNHCTTETGSPGTVDVRTLKCKDCDHQYTEIPKFIGKPEIKGLAYKRGDRGKLARELQGKVIDMLVGGVTVKDAHGRDVPVNPGLETPTDDVAHYRAAIEKMREHILSDPLTLDEVKWSKSLSQSLREYGKDASDAHVRVARILKDRGQPMAKGVRVEYVVVDGSESPQRVIPAEDYAGDCDRFYLWEQVYGPTHDLLVAAFPDEDWSAYEKVRPRKESAREKKVPEGQLGFMLDARPVVPSVARLGANEELAVPTYSAKPLEVRIPESAGLPAVDRVKEVLAAHPGARAVRLVIALNSGTEAVLRTSARVSPGPRFKEAIDRAITGVDASTS